MSHAHAQFIFSNGDVFFGEYDGTSDIMQPAMHRTPQEVDDHWRSDFWPECKCETPHEQCIAYTTYGGGFWWTGFACRVCMVFDGPSMPFYDNTSTIDGEPRGAVDYAKYYPEDVMA